MFDLGALKLAIFASFVLLFGWKALNGIAATQSVVRDRVYGVTATKPIQSVSVALLTAALSFGGYLYAAIPYLWLAVAVINLFVAFLVLGQFKVHDRSAAIDAELALGIDEVAMTKKVRARRCEALGQVVIILIWVYAWHNELAIA